MKNNTSQTPHNVIQSGSGDHPYPALLIRARITYHYGTLILVPKMNIFS